MESQEIRDKIIKSKDYKNEKVHVEEWGVDVYIREMSSADRLEFRSKYLKKDEEENLILDEKGDPIPDVEAAFTYAESLLVKTLADEDGKRIFSDDQVEELAQKSGTVLDVLYEKAAKLNNLRQSDIEDLEKNLQPSPSAVSASH